MGGRGSAGTAGRNPILTNLKALKPHYFIEDAYTNPIPTSENADRAMRILGDMPADVKPVTEEVDISKLKSSQDFIYKQPLLNNTTSGEPVVLKYEKEYIISDGHHRVLKALWNNQTKIKVKVYKVK